MKVQIPKGTFDILPYGTEDIWRLTAYWHHVEKVMHATAADYGYREIRTPIYERTELFDRGVGEASDIVTKEMFTFDDKAGRSLSLRPEGTSSVMRAFIEHHLSHQRPVHKFYYIGPMFRYERPQSGRYRQHHQFGIEALGIPDPEQDAEVIDLLLQVYLRLGLKNLKVHLNTVGDLDSRKAYREALVKYLRPQFDLLSEDSQVRFEKNPLRILDSKDPKDKEIVRGAPSILNHLTESARAHFQRLCDLLDHMSISYVVDDRIVRGLDYYSKTVFEVISEDLGSHSTIGAGGRYDGLVSTFGGPDVPGVGFATGMERILQVLAAQKMEPPAQCRPFVYFIPMGEEAKAKCLALATNCRHSLIPADVELSSKKLQNALQNAVKKEAAYCVILGDNEIHKGLVQLKNLQNREQREVSLEALLNELKSLCTSHSFVC